MKPKVLHIANDYLGSTVYKELYAKLTEKGVDQLVYCPLRSITRAKKNDVKNIPYTVMFSPVLKKYHKLLFHSKVRLLFNDITKQTDLKQIDIIHATTLFSDGSIAYKIFKKYNIPYIVTVRNTDLNLFFKYMFHLRSLGIEILRNADKIIFISPVYLKRFSNHSYICQYFREFEAKTKVIPNGVGDFWVENLEQRKTESKNPVQLLYIGKFTKGKNIDKLIQAVGELNNDDSRKYILNIVGGGGDKGEIEQLIQTKDFLSYHGKIYDKQKLKGLITQCDIFAMPSKAETFGLVYIEALSQGIPVVFTKNEGIDGLYKNNIGEAVDCNSIQSIAEGIKKIILNYNHYDFIPGNILKNHDWKEIAIKYIEIYNSVIK